MGTECEFPWLFFLVLGVATMAYTDGHRIRRWLDERKKK